jgi:ribose 1,5-bisphosphokinase PhnN
MVAYMSALGLSPLESRASLVPPAPSDGSPASLPESGINRAEDLRTVQLVLETKVVHQRLRDLGLSREEIDARLDRLSDAQLHQVATQITSLLPGGSLDGALGTILTVLLIILVAVVIVILI